MADQKLTALFVSNPISIDPGDLLYAVENTGTTPAQGAFKSSQLMFNRYKLGVTVASNNLTVALLHEDGSSPSTDRPLYFKIGTSLRAVTAALSVTKNAATNWCNAGSAELATKEIDFFAYLIWNTGPATDIVDIAFSRIPFGLVYSDFSATTTNEKYLAYGNGTAPASTDDVVNIGRFAATLSAGAGYTWSVPAYTTVNLLHQPSYETRVSTFVPQWTNLSVGNGSVTAVYQINRNILRKIIVVTFGSTTSISGSVSFSLPFSMATSINSNYPGNNNVTITDSGTAFYFGALFVNSSSLQTIYTKGVGGTYETLVALSSTVPMTWTTNDNIVISGSEYFIK